MPGLLLLALFFLCGVGLGQVLAGNVAPETGDAIRQYLRHYVTLEETLTPQAFLSALVLYLRYPLLAFLLGFASVGVVLLPCTAMLFGALLSFSASCFVATFGSSGVWIALAVSGFRCACTLPCFFLLAVPSFGTSAALARLSFGRGQRSAPVIYGRVCWLRLVVSLAVLLAGLCVDLVVSPRLLAWALNAVVT